MIYYRLVWRTRVRVAPEIVLSDEEREVLDELIRSKLTSVRLALRARVVLLAAQGLQNKEIALALDVGRIQASRWRERYLESGLQGIEHDLPRDAPSSTVDVALLPCHKSRQGRLFTLVNVRSGHPQLPVNLRPAPTTRPTYSPMAIASVPVPSRARL